MADKDVRVKITVTEDTKGAKKAAEAVKDVREEADKLDTQFKTTGKGAQKLNDELKTLYAERHRMATELSAGDDAELLKEHNRVNRRIALKEKLLKELRVGADNSVDPVLDMGGAGMKPRNAAIGGLVAAGVMTSPAWGALLAGALSGTVVGVAMAGGIIAATKDQSVRDAAGFFGQEISKEFFASGKSFVGPLTESLGILQRDFQDLNLGEAFAKAAPYVTIVAHGVGDLAKNIMPGFNKLLEKAGPYSEVFAEGLGGLGSALGDFMAEISASPGALEGLDAGFLVLNGTIIVLGRTLHMLSDIFDYGIRKNAEWLGVLEDIPLVGGAFGPLNDVLEHIVDSTSMAAISTEHYGVKTVDAAEAANNLADGLKRANDEFNTYYDIQASVDDTRIAARQNLIEFTETLAENGKHWENNTKAGLANQAALRERVDVLKAQRDAAVAAAGDDEAAVAKANREYDKSIKKLKEMATDAGITEEKFNDLAGTYTITFFVQQKAGKQVVAWSDLRNAERSSGGGKAQQGSAAGMGYEGFAKGGTTPAFRPFEVHDGEVLFSSQQHYVATASQVNSMRSGGGGGGTMTLRVIVEDTSGRTLTDKLVDYALSRGVSQDVIAAAYP